MKWLLDKKSFVVAALPAFNEERTIARVVLLARRHVDMVVCDDGSRDITAEIAERLGALVVRHRKNMGKGAALRTALGNVDVQSDETCAKSEQRRQTA